MKRNPALLLAPALAGCLDLDVPSRADSPQLTTLQANADSLDAVPRVPELRVAFDRAMAPPEPSSVMLFREALSPRSSPTRATASSPSGASPTASRSGSSATPPTPPAGPSAPPRCSRRPSRSPSSSASAPAPSRAAPSPTTATAACARPASRSRSSTPRAQGRCSPLPCSTPSTPTPRVLWLRADRPVRVLRADGVGLAGRRPERHPDARGGRRAHPRRAHPGAAGDALAADCARG
jgi:hypothetical protein